MFISGTTSAFTRAGYRVAVQRFVYAQHGRELMGLKSPVCEPLYAHLSVGQILDEGNCGADRSNGKSMRQRIPVLRRYVTGWLNYYGHSRSYTQLLELDQWLRRRVRLCYWKQWKRPRTRRRHLMALGISKDTVKLASRSRKGYWRMAGNSIVQRALTKQWLSSPFSEQ